MATNYTTMNAEGEVTIPAELREELHLQPGIKLSVTREGTAIVIQPITDEFIERMRGCTKGLGLGDLREKIHREYESL